MLGEDDQTGQMKSDDADSQDNSVSQKPKKNNRNLTTRMLRGLDLNNVISSSKLRNPSFKQTHGGQSSQVSEINDECELNMKKGMIEKKQQEKPCSVNGEDQSLRQITKCEKIIAQQLQQEQNKSGLIQLSGKDTQLIASKINHNDDSGDQETKIKESDEENKIDGYRSADNKEEEKQEILKKFKGQETKETESYLENQQKTLKKAQNTNRKETKKNQKDLIRQQKQLKTIINDKNIEEDFIQKNEEEKEKNMQIDEGEKEEKQKNVRAEKILKKNKQFNNTNNNKNNSKIQRLDNFEDEKITDNSQDQQQNDKNSNSSENNEQFRQNKQNYKKQKQLENYSEKDINSENSKDSKENLNKISSNELENPKKKQKIEEMDFIIPQYAKRLCKDKFRKKIGERINDEELNPDYIDPSLRFINKKYFFQSVFNKYRPTGRNKFILEINQAAMNESEGKITDPTLALKIFHDVYDNKEIISEENEQDEENNNNESMNIKEISDPVQAIQQMQKQNDQVYAMNYPSATYLNSDLRYLNFDVLLQKVKSFDIVYMDPPWRIKGGQMYDSQFMFSNNKFSLEYDTMSNKEIGDIQVEKLSKKGFMFLWILNTQLESASIIMQKWGYTVIDKIIWIKMKSQDRIQLTHGYYFMHSFEMCVVGYKDTTTSLNIQPGAASPQDNYQTQQQNSQIPHFYKGLANNVIFAEVRKKSQKPDEFYELMELLVPGATKIELFARNNNLRPGWLSIGNQLGENYEKWKDSVRCDICKQTIEKGKNRYKSKKEKDFDVCKDCFEEKKMDPMDFFFIENNVSEDVLHEYQMCNHCKIEPMWGIKFECKVCKDYDLCEACIDLNIASDPHFHDISHEMNLVEVPLYASGFQAHDRKCIGCYRSPILGPCVTCFECNGAYNLCQKCYFSKPVSEMLHKSHKEFHTMQIIVTPIYNESKKKKKIFPCVSCKQESKEDAMYKCQNCFNFYMCLECMAEKGKDMKAFTQNTHKPFHKLVQVSVKEELQKLREPQVHEQINQDEIFSEDSLYEEYDENGEVIKQIKVQNDMKNEEQEGGNLEEERNNDIIVEENGAPKRDQEKNNLTQQGDNTIHNNTATHHNNEIIEQMQKTAELLCESTKKKQQLGGVKQIQQHHQQQPLYNNNNIDSKQSLETDDQFNKIDKKNEDQPKRGRGRPRKQQPAETQLTSQEKLGINQED